MKSVKSSVVIAKLLGSEGFTDHVGNAIERYWKKTVMRRQASRKFARIEKEFSALITEKMDMKERMLLGRFIALHKRMSFDTGLRIGLTAYALKVDKPVELDEPREAVVDPQVTA